MIQTIDRSLAPILNFSDDIYYPGKEMSKLDNGIKCLLINSGQQDIVKIDFIFPAGKWYERERLTGNLTNKLIREGSKYHTSKELSEKLDFYGASVKNTCTTYNAYYTLYAMNKHLPNILPLMREILTEASLDENELNILKQKGKQGLRVQLKKNDFVANQEFFRVLYSEEHPFGYITKLEDYDVSELDLIRSYYEHNYRGKISKICVSGQVNVTSYSLLNEFFGQDNNMQVTLDPALHRPNPSADLEFRNTIEGSVQSAIRIGCHAINKTHPDFFDLKILNTIFGGYFGSRLMSNIREDKGYTYGIYSSLTSLLTGGYLSISTEVGHEYEENTIKEISFEIERLRNDLVDESELELVRNYMISKIQSSTDGPFHSSVTLLDLWNYDLQDDYLLNFIKRIREITPGDIQLVAQKYLDFSKMHKVVIS